MSEIQAWGWSSAVEKRRQAIPSGPDAPTNCKYRETIVRPAYFTLEMAELKQNKRIPETLLPQVEQLLKDRNSKYEPHEYFPFEAKTLIPRARELVEKSNNEPMMLDLLSDLLEANKQYEEAYELAKRASEQMVRNKRNPYPAWVILGAHITQHRCLKELDNLGDEKLRKHVSDQLTDSIIRYIIARELPAALASGYRSAISSAIHYHDINIDQIATIYKALKKQKDLPPEILTLAKAYHHLHRGIELQSREGADPAKAAGADAWTTPAQHRGKAIAAFKDLIKQHPDWPEPYTELILLEAHEPGTTGKTKRQWFSQAVKLRLDHYPAYNNMITAFYIGNEVQREAELWAFGLDCIATARFDTYIPGYIDHVYNATRVAELFGRGQKKAKIAAVNFALNGYAEHHKAKPEYVYSLKTKALEHAFLPPENSDTTTFSPSSSNSLRASVPRFVRKACSSALVLREYTYSGLAL